MDTLTADELELLRRIASVQEEEMVSLCIELGIIPDEPFRVEDVVDRVLDALTDQARRVGLPISKYDKEDLLAFSTQELRALAAALGVKPNPDHDPPRLSEAIIHRMRRVPRKLPRRSQIPLMLPLFLPALVRRLAAG